MSFKAAGEVAVLMSPHDRPSEVREIARVRHAGRVYIELEDGRRFTSIGGMGINTAGYIVAVRHEHRSALEKRLVMAGS